MHDVLERVDRRASDVLPAVARPYPIKLERDLLVKFEQRGNLYPPARNQVALLKLC